MIADLMYREESIRKCNAGSMIIRTSCNCSEMHSSYRYSPSSCPFLPLWFLLAIVRGCKGHPQAQSAHADRAGRPNHCHVRKKAKLASGVRTQSSGNGLPSKPHSSLPHEHTYTDKEDPIINLDTSSGQVVLITPTLAKEGKVSKWRQNAIIGKWHCPASHIHPRHVSTRIQTSRLRLETLESRQWGAVNHSHSAIIKSYRIGAGWPSGMQELQMGRLALHFCLSYHWRHRCKDSRKYRHQSLAFVPKKDGMLLDFHAKAAKSSAPTNRRYTDYQ
jgi:hypothetical protein